MEDDLKQGRTKEALDVCEKDGKRGIVLPAANSKENWFSDFDGVLDGATNQEVFDAIGGDLLRQFLSGINVSIMAYGQTGSGKTYTMFGCSEHGSQVQGLLHLVLHRIEEQIGARMPLARLSVSVFEVYNDELFVLLDTAGAEKRPMNKGMVEYNLHRPKQVNDVGEVVGLVLDALQLRARDSTVRNATSSRSHAFVKLRLEQAAVSPDEQGLDSTLFLVDLAGSESMSNVSSTSQQNETIHINKSLQALERVVNNLSNCSIHVPYRDSLLTQVLQEGLNPQKARVALVGTVSRFLADVHVTKSTLMFAQRARNIRTFAQVNVATKRPQQLCPEEIYSQLQNMQAINNKLRQQLADLESSQERLQGRSSLHVEAMRAELTHLVELHSELQQTSARQQQEAEEALEMERAAHGATRMLLVEAQRCNGELHGAVAAAEAEARTSTRLAGELQFRLHESQLQVVRLNGELAGAQSLAKEVQAQHLAALQQLTQTREQLTALKGQLAAAEAGGDELQRTIAQVLSEAQDQAATLQLQARELQQQVKATHADKTALAQELGETKQQLDEVLLLLQQQHEQYQQELHAMKDAQEAMVAALQQQQHDMMAGEGAMYMKEGTAAAAVDMGVEANLEWEGSDGTLAIAHELETAQGQLEARTSQLGEVEQQLAAAQQQLLAAAAEAEEQLAAAQQQMTAAAAEAEDQMAEARAAAASARAEAASLRQQLAEAAAARSAAEVEAAARLVPLQTECERLRAMCVLSEQQLERLQAECERLREEGGEAREALLRLQAECARLREAVGRAEAAERQAKLEAVQVERDVGPRPEAMKQLQERVRLLEAEKKRSETDHRGQLELKDKLIRQLENMNAQLQSEMTKLGHDPATANSTGGTGGDTPAGGPVAAGSSSPFANHYHQGSRSDSGASPAHGGSAVIMDDGHSHSPCLAGAAASAPPSRAPSSAGILLLNRTTTGSAAALARNNSRALATGAPLSSSSSLPMGSLTPPPAPRCASVNGAVTPSSAAAKAAAAMAAAAVAVTPPPAPAPARPISGEMDVLDLVTPEGALPGPPEPRLTPTSCPPMDDGVVMVMREIGVRRPDELKLATKAVRNQLFRLRVIRSLYHPPSMKEPRGKIDVL
ncbi:Kif9 type kinesin, partial [Volvox carteri f. nagariensis]